MTTPSDTPKDLTGLIKALGFQRQCDEDGVDCIVSRQAVHEAIEGLRELAALREQLAGRTEQLEVSIQNNALIKNGLLKRAERAEAELAKTQEALAAARAGQPIGPIVGAQTIVEQQGEIKRLTAEIAEVREVNARLDKLVSNQGIRLMEAEDAEAELAAHHSGSYCPHCNPCRRAATIAPLEDALRSLASWLGVGGYNAPTVDAKEFEAKIREGVELVLTAERERADRLIAFLADDALAITYQSLAQYRQAAIDAARRK